MRFYIRLSTVDKILKYGLFFFFVIMLETVTFPLTSENAVVADIVLCGVIALGIAEDEKTAGVCGLVAGFFLDALGGTGIALSPVIYALFGYLSGVCAYFFLRRNMLSYEIYIVFAAAAKCVITLAFICAVQTDVSLNLALRETVLPEFFYTLLASPIVYLIIGLPLERKNKQNLKN